MAKQFTARPRQPEPTHPDYLPGRARLLALMSEEGRQACQHKFVGTAWPITVPIVPAPVLATPADFLADITVLDLEFQPSADGGQMLELGAVRYKNLVAVEQMLRLWTANRKELANV